MTAKEMQRRNGKAQSLRVIQVDEGNYFVESSDGKIAYKAKLTDDKVYCTCLDYHKNGHNPGFRCKHLLAIMNCLPEGTTETKGFLARRQPRLEERFIKQIEGKDFVLYAGLLDLAHQKGLARMEVEIVQNPTAETALWPSPGRGPSPNSVRRSQTLETLPPPTATARWPSTSYVWPVPEPRPGP